MRFAKLLIMSNNLGMVLLFCIPDCMDFNGASQKDITYKQENGETVGRLRNNHAIMRLIG